MRAVRSIGRGEEMCVSYIDSFDNNFNTRQARQRVLDNWGFVCDCQVCSLPSQQQQENDDIRYYRVDQKNGPLFENVVFICWLIPLLAEKVGHFLGVTLYYTIGMAKTVWVVS